MDAQTALVEVQNRMHLMADNAGYEQYALSLMECPRCGEGFTIVQQLAEIMGFEDYGTGETGPKVRETSFIVHVQCMREGDEIA